MCFHAIYYMKMMSYNLFRLAMAQGIPLSLFFEVLDLFSLPNFPRNRFYHSSAPRQILQGPWKLENLLFLKNSHHEENFIFLDPWGISNCHSSITRGVKFSEELPSLLQIILLHIKFSQDFLCKAIKIIDIAILFYFVS